MYTQENRNKNSVFIICLEPKNAAYWVAVSNIFSDDESWIIYDSLNYDFSKYLEPFKIICPNNDFVVLHKAYVSKPIALIVVFMH